MTMQTTVDVFASALFEQVAGLQALDKALAPIVAAHGEATEATLSAANLLVVELRSQLAELRERLAIAQEDLIEMARDAGGAQAEIVALQARVADAEADRDAWRAQASCLSARVPR
jgi:chromosome segregation ATPase